MMSVSDFIVEPGERVFRRSASAGSGTVLWLVGGLFFLGVAVVGMGVAAFTRVDQIALHLMSTLPAIIGVGLLIGAWNTAHTPEEVGVGADGLRIVERGASRTYAWHLVGWSMVEGAPLSNRRLLRIYDPHGGTLVRLSDAIEDFDGLVEAVAARISAKGDDTAARVQTSRAKRSAVTMALGGIAFLALSGFLAWDTSRNLRAERLLRTSAVPATARIERRFIAPNRITRRLEYRVTDANGRSAARNAEVEQPVWDSLEGATTVPVMAVPGEPEISRLAVGERERRDAFKNPLIGYGLPAVVALMSLVFLAASVLMARGWDIDLDSKTGRLSIKRFGTGR